MSIKELIKEKPKSFGSIDASTNSLAFAFYKEGRLEDYGKIKFYGNDIYDKIVDISHKTKAFFDRYDMQHIVIEQVIYLNSPKTAANLAMAHGALVSSAALAGVEYIASVSPMQWQNWAGNKRLTAAEKQSIQDANPGKSSSWYKTQERLFRKQRTIKFVNDKFGLQVSDDDVADAIAIGAWSLDNWGKMF